MKSFDIHKWQRQYITEDQESLETRDIDQLIGLLKSSIEKAKTVHENGKRGPEGYEGNEGAEIGMLLEQIWNAFSTGDPTNDSEAREIFK